jgi:hypothetical protein
MRHRDKPGKVSLILLAVSSLQAEGLMDERVKEGGARVPLAARRAACLRLYPNEDAGPDQGKNQQGHDEAVETLAVTGAMCRQGAIGAGIRTSP